MFEQLKRLANNTINLNVNELSVSVFKLTDVQRFIIRLNRVEQLYNEGLDSNDKVIGTYSYTTALLAGEETYIFNGLVSTKKVGEPYTLFESGEFYESFKVRIESDGFVITANTKKEDRDLMEFGPILGLTKQSKHELGKEITPFLTEAIRESILKEVL